MTTRTALLRGFAHDSARHRYAFFDSGIYAVGATSGSGESAGDKSVGVGVGVGVSANASLNNMGYSPVPLDEYLGFIEAIVTEGRNREKEKERGREKGKAIEKLFIVSVTGTPEDVAECYKRIVALGAKIGAPLAMEINLSCPNIPGAPPPAYSAEGLRSYLHAVARTATEEGSRCREPVPWGVKTPPYTHAGQFDMLVGALGGGLLGSGGPCPASFVTATNTLGSCLLLDGGNGPALGGEMGGIGGMAGAPCKTSFFFFVVVLFYPFPFPFTRKAFPLSEDSWLSSLRSCLTY